MVAVQLLAVLALLLAARRHVHRLNGRPAVDDLLFAASYVVLVVYLVLSVSNRVLVAGPNHRRRTGGRHARALAARAELARRRVTVVIPVFNEDLRTLTSCLRSVAAQTRPVDRIHLVNDGSDDPTVVHRAAAEIAATFAGELLVTAQPNRGKRHAQGVAFSADPDAWVFVTTDSDTVLDEHAVEELVQGYADDRVTAVGGVLIGLNATRSLLTRLVDVSFTTSFLNGRAAGSTLGSVVVHCGGLASYRADVVRRYQRYYVNQTVLGAPVSCGDDRMLTTLALLHGRSVTQESAMGYTLLPENLSHLTRQRVRWWRSYFWGGMWCIKHVPMNRAAWWMTAQGFVMFGLFSVLTPLLLLVIPLTTHRFLWELLEYLAILGYLRSVRYLTIARPGESLWHRVGLYALTPLSALLNIYLCSGLQYVGLATVRDAGWGTRSQVEVGMAEV